MIGHCACELSASGTNKNRKHSLSFQARDSRPRALREQVPSALEVIIQASRLPDHSRKVVYISEVNSLGENGEYQVTDIFKFVRTGFKGKTYWLS